MSVVTGATTTTFTYDGLGRRRQKGTVGTLYDGWNPVQLKNGTTVVENRLTGLGLDSYYVRVTGGVVQIYVTDALGSTLQLRDAAQNAVTSYIYDPYGGTAPNANTNLVKYTGREQDLADLYYYRNRYYKPSIGRFISEDPIGLAGGDSNLYAYVTNNPVNFVDPTGETPWGLIFAGGDLALQLYENDGNWKCVNWGQVGFNLLGGGLLNAIGKGALRFKTFGSHTWGATRSWMNSRGIQMLQQGQHRHHWLFERNQGIGRFVRDWVKNQPWNTNPISAEFNNWLGRHPNLSWLGAPSWVGEVAAGGGLSLGGGNGESCECR